MKCQIICLALTLFGISQCQWIVHQNEKNTNIDKLDESVQIDTPPTPFVFEDKSFSNLIFVSSNGYITFGTSYDKYEPPKLDDTGVDIVSPFFADHDIRNSGEIVYEYITDSRTDVLNLDYEPSYCLVVTWRGVTGFDHPITDLNTYQAVLCTNGNRGSVIFNYQQIQWFSTSGKQPSIGFFIPSRNILRQLDGDEVALITSNTQKRLLVTARPIIIDDDCRGDQRDGLFTTQDCSTFYRCCNGVRLYSKACPSGSNIDLSTFTCLEEEKFPCNRNDNPCNGRSNNDYAIEGNRNEFFRCTEGAVSYHKCQPGGLFAVNCNRPGGT